MYSCITTDSCNCDQALNLTDEHNAAVMFIQLLLKESRFQLHLNNKHIINVYTDGSIMHRFFGVQHEV